MNGMTQNRMVQWLSQVLENIMMTVKKRSGKSNRDLMHISLYETQMMLEHDTMSLLFQIRQETDINLQQHLQTLILNIKIKVVFRGLFGTETCTLYCTLTPRNFLPSPLEALCISQTHSALY
jgi:hypothetical protein